MKRNIKTLACLICAVGMAWGLASCAQMKAAPSKGGGFVPLGKLQHDAALPFDKAWIADGIDWSAFKSIAIAPVNTQYLIQSQWWQQNLRQGLMQKDAQAIALYMRQQFANAFRSDPRQRFRVVEAAGPDSVILELALTELVPSNVVVEAAALAAPKGSGLAISAAEQVAGTVATVAFEARVKNAKTGQVIAMFADREQPKINPVDLKQLTWYAEAQEIIGDWANEAVKVAGMRSDEIVKPAPLFSLKPW
ncbi:DUF3313 family protein [uncultured Thiodictyon sp.]|uniref:DUF3313 family protein n=1 Tax=uncultured Thiodictyon sp. TaxID=1846217 RepID=UPI0025D5598B|nr:DUF3313 family protein [uncultured Thiodictyon sp.]